MGHVCVCVCIYIYIHTHIYIYICKLCLCVCEALDHETSLKSLGHICSNSQKYIVWVKIINFYFMPQIIKILSRDHVP